MAVAQCEVGKGLGCISLGQIQLSEPGMNQSVGVLAACNKFLTGSDRLVNIAAIHGFV